MHQAERDRRPLSPHLQIYRLQITSVMSGLHRLSGIALALGATFLVAWFLALAGGPNWFGCAVGFVNSTPGAALLFCATAAFFYHACNGVRHLAWDAGWGFELPVATATGWIVVALAGLLSGALWAWAIY